MFEKLKRKIIKVSILTHFDFILKTIVKTNSFNYVFADVISERKKIKLYNLLLFFSKNLFLAKFNYEIYDKKLLTIIKYFEK